jgi:hypothetical protein
MWGRPVVVAIVISHGDLGGQGVCVLAGADARRRDHQHDEEWRQPATD